MCQDPKKIWDPGSSGFSIRNLDLIFSFSSGILEMFDPVTAKWSWDPRNPGSQTEKMLLDPRDPGSYLDKLPLDLADLWSCTHTEWLNKYVVEILNSGQV